MYNFSFVTDSQSRPIDFDMPLLLDACRETGLSVEVCEWDDPTVDWSCFDSVLLRSPWDYTRRLSEFLGWCEQVSNATQLHNPLSVVRWSLDKRYLRDLAAQGVPVVPSVFVDPGEAPLEAFRETFIRHPYANEVVVKPTVGAYSKDVGRYTAAREDEALRHISRLHAEGFCVILQPYLDAIDRDGETDLIYFDGEYSHAIRKAALLMPDGTVNVPATEFRSARYADEDERAVALSALEATASHLGLEQPLLYARVDLVRDDHGRPLVLELEICEPSLSLPFDEGGAMRFAQALAKVQAC